MPDRTSSHGRRPRPVAGLPAVDADAVAKAWLLELLARAPLAEVGAVPAARLAAEAPALCAAIVAAVADDDALDRLCRGDGAVAAARAGALAGAAGPAEIVAAVEALRAVLHRALRAGDDAGLAADTGDRLAHVCAQVAALALAPPAAEKDAAAPVTSAGVPPASVAAPRVVPPDGPGRIVVAPGARAEAAPAAAVREALEHPGGHPLTVLAIEVDDLERLTALEGEPGLLPALLPVEEALAAASGPDDVLVREQPGRWWLVVPRTGTDAARVLAGRVSDAVVAAAPVRHHVALTASIGVAVFPDDGEDVQALLDHADQGVFTARALGVPVA